MTRQHVNGNGVLDKCGSDPSNPNARGCPFGEENHITTDDPVVQQEFVEAINEQRAYEEINPGKPLPKSIASKVERLRIRGNPDIGIRSAGEVYIPANGKVREQDYDTPEEYYRAGKLANFSEEERKQFAKPTYNSVTHGVHATEGYMGASGFAGENSGGYRSPKEIASAMREDLKQAKKDDALPKDAKISIRSSSAGGGSVYVTVNDLEEQDVYEYAHANMGHYMFDRRNLSRPALDLGAKRNDIGSVKDNVERIHDSYNYSNSNSMVDYFDRGFYGDVKTNSKFDTARQEHRRLVENEQKAIRNKGYGSPEQEKLTARRLAAEDKIKEAATARAERIQAYRKLHIHSTTVEGSPQRTQGDFKLAVAGGDNPLFSPASTGELVPEIERDGKFVQDDIAFNHNPLGPQNTQPFEEAPSGDRVRYQRQTENGSIETIVSFHEKGRVEIDELFNGQSRGKQVFDSPQKAADYVKNTV